jgi:tetratricopeptide (TPR) repeat protein
MKGRVFVFFGICALLELFWRVIAKIIFDIQPIDSAGWLGLPFWILLCVWPPSYKNREEMPDVEYKLTRKTIAILIFIAIITSVLFSYWMAEPDAWTYNNRGLAYAEEGDYELAIANYNQAIKQNPNFVEMYYYNRGSAYFNKGDYDSAIWDFSKAIQLESNFAMAYNNRGLAYVEKGDYERAITNFNQAILIDTNLAMPYHNRGSVFRRNGDYDSAILDLNQAIRLDPNYANAYNNRGLAYFNKGYYDEAIADYNQALQINPNDTNIIQNLELARELREQESRNGDRKMLAEEY